MKLQIFAVYDSVAGAYLQPFFMHNVPSALRALQDVLSDPNHTFNKHAEDYHLAVLGEYDDGNGVIVPADVVTKVCYLNELRNPQRIGELSNDEATLS